MCSLGVGEVEEGGREGSHPESETGRGCYGRCHVSFRSLLCYCE